MAIVSQLSIGTIVLLGDNSSTTFSFDITKPPTNAILNGLNPVGILASLTGSIPSGVTVSSASISGSRVFLVFSEPFTEVFVSLNLSFPQS